MADTGELGRELGRRRTDSRARWLVRFLLERGGSASAAEAKEALRLAFDVSEGSIFKIRQRAGVVSKREQWVWTLPEGPPQRVRAAHEDGESDDPTAVLEDTDVDASDVEPSGDSADEPPALAPFSRGPPERGDRVAQAEEELRLAQERRFSASAPPGHAWRECVRCHLRSMYLDDQGRCYECART